MLNGKEFLENWLHRVWSEEDTTAIDELFLADGKAKGLGSQPLVGPADFKLFYAALCALLRDINISVDLCVQEGPWVSAVCRFCAQSQTSSEKVDITGSIMVRIEGGMIREGYNHWDFMAMWEQLGLLPNESFETGLMGNKIV